MISNMEGEKINTKVTLMFRATRETKFVLSSISISIRVKYRPPEDTNI